MTRMPNNTFAVSSYTANNNNHNNIGNEKCIQVRKKIHSCKFENNNNNAKRIAIENIWHQENLI